MAAISDTWSSHEVLEIAKRQKQILWMIVISFVAMFILYATILTGLIQMFFIFKLAQAVRSSVAWLYIILAFIPLLGLIGLVILNQSATKTLKAHGVNVGLMGANSSDLEKLNRAA